MKSIKHVNKLLRLIDSSVVRKDLVRNFIYKDPKTILFYKKSSYTLAVTGNTGYQDYLILYGIVKNLEYKYNNLESDAFRNAPTEQTVSIIANYWISLMLSEDEKEILHLKIYKNTEDKLDSKEEVSAVAGINPALLLKTLHRFQTKQ